MSKLFKITVLLLIQFYCVLSLVNGHKKLFDPEKWNQFKLNYNKTYLKQSDEHYHRSIFFANLGRIENHNRRADQRLESYRLSINHFSDMEYTDFARRVLRYKPLNKNKLSKGRFYHYKTNVSASEASIDWRTKGVVSDIRDQGTCGSCWAFASVAAIESALAMANSHGEPKVPQLSEQNLIDCSFAEGNEGCLGGTMEAAYQYVLDADGLDTRQSYPYEDRQSECRFNSDKIGGKIKSYVEIFPDSEDDLLNAASKHVVSVAIQATASFQLYSGGIFDDPTCDNRVDSLNHAVAVIGYGSSDGQDYWLVKNSWGKYWGENGFGRIKRGSNHCGIASQASYPIA